MRLLPFVALAIALAWTAPVRAAGCEGVALEGTLRTTQGETPVDIQFDTGSARIEDGAAAATDLAVRHETCTEETIAFDLTDRSRAAGSCLLYLHGSQATGDCALGDKRDIAVSALVDRTGGDRTGSLGTQAGGAGAD